ncbi:uncharacterized protein LOC118417116 [Branchiostoma floridae]|uniref:Uncharacterized protein LOC118417116 n=1 Tax=Branchiostoma floridae TaxID=7739 RepID=A0A9J7MTP4_BRAFL|nr:uncharacterized protein LOC118417116 [Branchiostoma floridae]
MSLLANDMTPVSRLSRHEVAVSLDTIRALQEMVRQLNESVTTTKTAAQEICEQADAMQRTTHQLQMTLSTIYTREVHAKAMEFHDQSETLLGELSLINSTRRLSRSPKKKGRRSASQIRQTQDMFSST